MTTTTPSTSAPVDATDQYHIGIVADDPTAVMDDLSTLFGYEWAEQIGGSVEVELPGGLATIDLRAWYSTTAPQLEVVQSIPGTVWIPAAGSGVHHIGYWVDDVAAASTALVDAGYTLEVKGLRADGSTPWAYLRGPEGPRVELVSTQMRPVMDAYFANGRVSS